LHKTNQPGIQARQMNVPNPPTGGTRHPCLRCPSAWPKLVPAPDWLISCGKKGSHSSVFLLTWPADWSWPVNAPV